jgi:hypothetical protein
LAGEPNFLNFLADCAEGLHFLVGHPQLLRSPLIEKAARGGNAPPRLLGTYTTPAFRIGQRVACALRGEVEIVGLSAGLIPWPIGRVPCAAGSASLATGTVFCVFKGVNRRTIFLFAAKSRSWFALIG